MPGVLRRLIANKFVWIFLILAGLYTLAGFYLVPRFIESKLPGVLEEALDRPVHLGRVRFNPFSLRLEAANFRVDEKDGGVLFSLDSLVVNIELESIPRRAIVLDQLILSGPVVNLAVEPDGGLNLAALGKTEPPDAARAAAHEEPWQAPRLLIKHLLLEYGKVELVDRRYPRQATLRLEPVQFDLYDLSTLAENAGPFQLDAQTAQGEKLAWRGELSLKPVLVKGGLEFQGVKASTLWEHLAQGTNLDMPQGTLDFSANYHLSLAGKEPGITVTDIEAVLKGLKLAPRGAAEGDRLALDSLSISGGDVDIMRQTIQVDDLILKGLDMAASRDAEGNLAWLGAEGTGSSTPASATAASAEGEGDGPAWKVHLSRVRADGRGLSWLDRGVPTPLSTGAGEFKLKLSLGLSTSGPELPLTIAGLDAEIKGLHLGSAEKPDSLLALDQAAVTSAALDLAGRRIGLDSLDLQGGRLKLALDEGGGLNWQTFFAGDDPGVSETGSSGDSPAPEAAAAEQNPHSEPDWRVEAKSARAAGLGVEWRDRSGEPPVDINLAGVELELDTPSYPLAAALPFRLAFKVERPEKSGADQAGDAGGFSVAGRVMPGLAGVEADYRLAELDLATLAPYLNRLANLNLDKGVLTSQGVLHYASEGGDRPEIIALKAGLFVNLLELSDPSSGDLLIGLTEMSAPEMNLDLVQGALNIARVGLLEPYLNLSIGPQGIVNLAEAFKRGRRTAGGAPKSEEAKDAGGKPAFVAQVDHIKVERGQLDFSDQSNRPSFSTRIGQLGGSIRGWTSRPGERAQVQLDGRVDEYGQAKIEGGLEPDQIDSDTELRLDLVNIAMHSLSPYSSRFAGYEIESGKLDLYLKYNLEKGRLHGENKIVARKLELGPKVESPEAVGLPLELAIALLKDSQGVIDLDLPVAGNLNEPQVSVGSIVGKALSNLLGKVVSAPFRLLASLVGASEEDLRELRFEPGQDRVLPPEMENLTHLAQALAQRPQLNLIVKGGYDPGLDGPALVEMALRREVAALRGDKETADPGPISFTSAADRKALEELFIKSYSAAQLAVVRAGHISAQQSEGSDGVSKDALAKANKALSMDLYERLRSAGRADQARMRTLGQDRGAAVQKALVGMPGMDAGRVKQGETQETKGDAQRGVPVELSLEAID